MPPAYPPTLEVFYSPACAPCRLELPVVAAFAKEGGRVQVTILDQEDRARDQLRKVSAALETNAKTDIAALPGAVLRTAGDSDGILPYARSTANSRICAKWEGRLTIEKARSLIAACARAFTSRPPPRS